MLIGNATNSRSERVQLRRPLSTMVSPGEVPANDNGDEDDDGSSWLVRFWWWWFFLCSRQLKVYFHRFLIYERHPTWSLYSSSFFVVFVVTSLCREWDRASPRRQRSSNPSPGTRDCRSCTHQTWRLTIWVRSYIFITFSFFSPQTSQEGVLGFRRLYSPTTGGPIKVAIPCEWSMCKS